MHIGRDVCFRPRWTVLTGHCSSDRYMIVIYVSSGTVGIDEAGMYKCRTRRLRNAYIEVLR
jgi:hypothetical protein